MGYSMDMHLKKLTLIDEATRAMTALMDIDPLLDRILALTTEVFRVDTAAILLVDGAKGALTIRRARGYDPAVVATFEQPLGEGITGKVAYSGEPLYIPDVTADDRYIQGVHGAVCEMAAPLKLNGTIIGVLDVESQERDAFSDDDLTYLAVFANHAAIALNNASLYSRIHAQSEALERRLDDLKLLNTVGTLLGESLDLDETLHRILEVAKDALHFSSCAILLPEEGEGPGRALTVAASVGYPASTVRALRIEEGHGITGRVYGTREPLLVPDVEADNTYIKGLNGGRAEMAVPMVSRGELVGVMDAESPVPHAFGERELELFRVFASQAATAVRNAMFYREMEQRNRNLAILNQCARRVSSSLDLDRVLDEVLTLAQEALGFKACAVMLVEGDETLRLTASIGYPKSIDSSFAVTMDHGITGKAAQTGKPQLIADVRSDTDYIPGVAGGRCEMAVPIMTGQELVGVLDAEAQEPGAFTARDLALFQAFASQVAAALQNARMVQRQNDTYYGTIRSLAQALEARDAYTRGHSERVTSYSVEIAREMGLDDTQLELIEQAGLLHDIGKIGIRDEVLNKPSKLSAEDREIIEHHPAFGDQILGHVHFLEKAMSTILYHHERYDGKGYPAGLQGDEIPIIARIVAVADSFDAMTSNRPYRDAQPLAYAVDELMKHKGTQFDPKVVDAFIALLERKGVELG